jgi:hypothetical protein
LDAEEGEAAEHGGHHGADEAVAGEGAFGEAAINECDGDAAALGDGEEVGPGFELDESDGIGADAVEEGVDGNGEIDGETNRTDAGVVFVEGLGAGGAGVGGGGDGEEEVRVGIEELAEEGVDGKEFADTDAVEEEEFLVRQAVGKDRGTATEAGGPAGAVLAGAEAFEGEGGRDDGEGEGVEEVEEHGGMIKEWDKVTRGQGDKVKWVLTVGRVCGRVGGRSFLWCDVIRQGGVGVGGCFCWW